MAGGIQLIGVGKHPVLFPICGSVRNDTVLYDKEDGSQKEGKIPRHGLVRKKEFTLVEQTYNSDYIRYRRR